LLFEGAAKGDPMTTIEAPARALRILVVDDDHVGQRLVTGLAGSLGHRVAVAGTGSEALTLLAHEPFDLVLMDLRMPVLDGYAATAAIRRREAAMGGRRTPIVALTSGHLEHEEASCLAGGMDRCLAKPVKAHELAALLAWLAARDSVAQVVAETPAVDLLTLDGYRQMGVDFLGWMIDAFLLEAPARVAAMDEACDSRDARALRAEAYLLKGSARIFGAALLADRCEILQQTGEADATAFARVRGIEAELGRVRNALEMARPRWRSDAR
jgi:two-component system, sensor histidine kinase and response regulator